jgi:hypothetical protein
MAYQYVPVVRMPDAVHLVATHGVKKELSNPLAQGVSSDSLK